MQRLFGNCYNRKYLGYVYVNEIGELIKPDYITEAFSNLLKKNGSAAYPLSRYAAQLRKLIASQRRSYEGYSGMAGPQRLQYDSESLRAS